MFSRVPDSQNPPSSQVDLRDVAALTFRRGKMTASRRVSPIPQVGTAATVPATLAAIKKVVRSALVDHSDEANGAAAGVRAGRGLQPVLGRG